MKRRERMTKTEAWNEMSLPWIGPPLSRETDRQPQQNRSLLHYLHLLKFYNCRPSPPSVGPASPARSTTWCQRKLRKHCSPWEEAPRSTMESRTDARPWSRCGSKAAMEEVAIILPVTLPSGRTLLFSWRALALLGFLYRLLVLGFYFDTEICLKRKCSELLVVSWIGLI